MNSPHVIPIHHYGEIDGCCMSTCLVEGRDLHTVLDDGPLEPARAVHIIGQVAEASAKPPQISATTRTPDPT